MTLIHLLSLKLHLWSTKIAHRHIKTEMHCGVAIWPVEASVGGALGDVLGTDTDQLVAASVLVFLLDRPVRFHAPEVQIVVCGVRLTLGGYVTLETVSYR